MKQKNKKVQYLLVVLVIVIWGYIAIQFFSYNGGEIAITESNYNYLPVAKANTKNVFQFSLNLNYEDPFLSRKRGVSKASSNSEPINKTRNIKNRIASNIQQKINPRQLEKYPKVIYKGYSLNNNQITRVNLSINNKVFSMKAGESQDGLFLKETYRDSLLVSFKGKKQMIFRKK